MNQKVIFLNFLLTVFFSSCTFYNPKNSLLSRADAALENKEYDEAITLYKEHIESRLDNPLRSSWENPYFYLIVIGDVYIEKKEPKKAEITFLKAEKKGVKKPLINDRLLKLASYYEKNHQFSEAIELLDKNIDRDPILFEGYLDKISRYQTTFEDSKQKE